LFFVFLLSHSENVMWWWHWKLYQIFCTGTYLD